MEPFVHLLIKNRIKILDLSWNNIRTTGSNQLVKGLEQNTSLLSLNLSFNSLASGPNKNVLCNDILANKKVVFKKSLWKLRKYL